MLADKSLNLDRSVKSDSASDTMDSGLDGVVEAGSDCVPRMLAERDRRNGNGGACRVMVFRNESMANAVIRE